MSVKKTSHKFSSKFIFFQIKNDKSPIQAEKKLQPITLDVSEKRWRLEQFMQHHFLREDALKINRSLKIVDEENFASLIHALAPRYSDADQVLRNSEEKTIPNVFHPGVIISALVRMREKAFDYSLSGKAYEVSRLLYTVMGREQGGEIDDDFMSALKAAFQELREKHPDLAEFADSRSEYDLFLSKQDKEKLKNEIIEKFGEKIVVQTMAQDEEEQTFRPSMRR